MSSEAKGAGSELQESRLRTSTLASLTTMLALALAGDQGFERSGARHFP
jgi:hypothetical protein